MNRTKGDCNNFKNSFTDLNQRKPTLGLKMIHVNRLFKFAAAKY